MDRLKRLIDTTAVKLSLKYSLLYILILGIAFLVLYAFITRFVEDQIKINLIKESKKLSSIYNKSGLKTLKRYILSHEQFKGEDHIYYLLVDKHGKFIAGDLRKWPSGVRTDKSVRNIWIAEKNIIDKVSDGDGFWPVIALHLKGGSRVLIAQGIKGTEDLRETLFAIMAVIFTLIVMLTLTIGLFLGRSVLWHVDNIKDACRSIIDGDLSKRINISTRNDEFDMIAKYINGMLDELERFIEQSKETSTNIAHDLRTPLNRIRNKLERILIKDNAVDSTVFDSIMKDVDKIIKMINSLLEISQIETGVLRKNWDKLDLSEVVRSAVNFYRPFAEEKGIEIILDADSDILITGNKQLLSQSIINILDNAIKYTQQKGKIEVSVKKREGFVSVSICDNGQGIEQEYYEKITKKFFRLDEARTKDGNGLGLSLVKAAADLHKATLSFRDNNPGLCVILEFGNCL